MEKEVRSDQLIAKIFECYETEKIIAYRQNTKHMKKWQIFIENNLLE